MKPALQTKPFHAHIARIAAYLAHRIGGAVQYVKLLKLVYLADRESLKRYGHPITFDDYQALPRGPVPDDLHQVLERGEHDLPEWKDAIAVVGVGEDRVVVPRNTIEQCIESLSASNIEILDHLVKLHGARHHKELVRYTHGLGEWRKVRRAGRGTRLTYEDILVAVGRDPADAKEIAADIRAYRTERAAHATACG